MTIDFDVIVPQLTPDVQVETDWTGGLNALPTDQKKVLLLGHKTAAGVAAAGAVKQVVGLAKAIEDFGKGSELAIMAERALAIAPRCPIFAVAYAEAGGGVAATGTVVIAGSPSSTGTLTVIIGGRRVQVGISKTDTPTSIGDALVLAVNGLANGPVTAANNVGTVTMTCRNKGTAGNSIRMSGSITAAGLTATIAAALTAGATDGDPTSVLAGIEGDRYHLIAHNLQDVTSVPILVTDREKQSTPAVKKWGLGIVGCTGTRGTAETLQGTAGVPSYRLQLVWQQECVRPCYELAAAFAALRATKPANRSLDDLTLPGFTPPVDETKWPNAAELEAALASGLTPIRALRDGSCQVVRSVIAKTTASVPSYRDHNPVEISDYTDEYLVGLFAARLKGRPLKTGSAPGTPATVTPGRATALLNEALFKLDRLDYLQGVEAAIKAGLHFAEVNAVDPNRLDVAFRFWPIAQAHFIAVKKTYVTSAS